jgi:hypothetical protein
MRLPRCRAVMKWVGAWLCAAIAAAWLTSGWRYVGWDRNTLTSYTNVAIADGLLTYSHMEYGTLSAGEYVDPPNWSFYMITPSRAASDSRWLWWFWYRAAPVGRGGHEISLSAPLWLLFLILGPWTTWLFHRDRRHVRWAREGRCVGCGYDLSGVTGPCPECGRKAA